MLKEFSDLFNKCNYQYSESLLRGKKNTEMNKSKKLTVQKFDEDDELLNIKKREK